MSDKLILNEYIEDYRELLEAVKIENNGKKTWYLQGIFMQADIVNRNGRYYPLQEFEKAVPYFNENIIPSKRAVGELDHSDSSGILLHRISHIFEEPLKIEGSNVIGKARILDTQYGKTLQILCEEKIPFGVSSKGLGKLENKKINGKKVKYVKNFVLVSPGDVVYNQSAPDAIPNIFFEMIMSKDKRIMDIFNEEIVDKVYQKIFNKNLPKNTKDSWQLFLSLFDKEI